MLPRSSTECVLCLTGAAVWTSSSGVSGERRRWSESPQGEGRQGEKAAYCLSNWVPACTIAPQWARPLQLKLYIAQPINTKHCGSHTDAHTRKQSRESRGQLSETWWSVSWKSSKAMNIEPNWKLIISVSYTAHNCIGRSCHNIRYIKLKLLTKLFRYHLVTFHNIIFCYFCLCYVWGQIPWWAKLCFQFVYYFVSNHQRSLSAPLHTADRHS